MSKRPRKICVLNTNGYPSLGGGAEISCRNLAEDLREDGFDVMELYLLSVSTFLSGNRQRYSDVENLPLLNLYWPFGKRRRSNVAKLAWNILDLFNFPMALMTAIFLKARRVDVLHSNNLKGYSPLLPLACRLMGVRTVHTTRDFYMMDRKSWFGSGGASRSVVDRMEQSYKTFLASYIDGIVFNSRYMDETHRAAGVFSSCKERAVIYNGFDNVPVPSRPKESIYTFGYIGRFSYEKGIDDLVREFAKIADEAACNLLIAGGTEDDFLRFYPEMKDLLTDKVTFAGFMKSEDFYQQVDCVIVPSKYNEPFGRVAMEAIFSRLPVIVSDRGGLPEQIIPGVNGKVATGGNYADAMRFFRSQGHMSADHPAPAALEIFSRPYSRDRYAAMYAKVLSP